MTDATVAKARRELNNLRGVVRRTGTTGWVNRSAKFNYQRAFAAVVAVEDAIGIEHPDAIKVADRLDDLRREAQAAGLLTPREIMDAEKAAV